jgi:hypothetical protein
MEGEWRPRCRHTFSFLNLKQEMNSKINGLAKRALVFLVTLVLGQTAFANNVAIEDFSIAEGQTKEIPVYFNVTHENGTGSVQFNILLPDNLTLDDATVNTARLGKKFSTVVTQNNYNHNFYQVLVMGKNNAPAITGEGILCYLTVTATEDYDGVGGKITISDFLTSDFVSYEEIVDEELSAGASAYVIANIDLSGSDVVVTKADSVTTNEVAIDLSGSVGVYGLQADITLPEGLRFEEDPDEDKPTPLFSVTNRSSRFDVLSAYVDGQKNVATILLSNLSSTAMTGTEGAILTFNVIADESLAESGKIEFTNIIASQKNGKAVMKVADFDIAVVNNSIPTSIESAPAAASASEVVGIYTLTGQKVSSVEKGQVYLLKSSNGTTAKVLVK